MEHLDAIPNIPQTAQLQLFDIARKFGPSIGISRKTRWMRSKRLGLCPPLLLFAILSETAVVWQTVRGAK